MTRNIFAVGAVTLGLSACVSNGVVPQPSSAADATAKQWLMLIDNGNYAESWDKAGGIFKGKISSQDWQTKVTPYREALGSVVTRETENVTLSNALPGAPDGQYAVVKYNSTFAHKAAAVETLTLDKENDTWAVIGYFIN